MCRCRLSFGTCNITCQTQRGHHALTYRHLQASCGHMYHMFMPACANSSSVLARAENCKMDYEQRKVQGNNPGLHLHSQRVRHVQLLIHVVHAGAICKVPMQHTSSSLHTNQRPVMPFCTQLQYQHAATGANTYSVSINVDVTTTDTHTLSVNHCKASADASCWKQVQVIISAAEAGMLRIPPVVRWDVQAQQEILWLNCQHAHGVYGCRVFSITLHSKLQHHSDSHIIVTNSICNPACIAPPAVSALLRRSHQSNSFA